MKRPKILVFALREMSSVTYIIWLIKLKPRAVNYQNPGFPLYTAHDVPRP